MALMAIDEIVLALHMALMAVVTRLLVVRELTVPASSFISRVVVLQQGAAFTLLPCVPAPMVRETTTQNQALRSYGLVLHTQNQASDVACDRIC